MIRKLAASAAILVCGLLAGCASPETTEASALSPSDELAILLAGTPHPQAQKMGLEMMLQRAQEQDLRQQKTARDAKFFAKVNESALPDEIKNAISVLGPDRGRAYLEAYYMQRLLNDR